MFEEASLECQSATILVVDDDNSYSDAIRPLLDRISSACIWCKSLSEAFAIDKNESVDLVFIKPDFHDGNAIEKIPNFLMLPGAPQVVVFSEINNTANAESAIKYGAWDYLIRPCPNSQIEITIARAMRYRAMKSSVKDTFEKKSFRRYGIIGDSIQMETVLDGAGKASSSNISVMISGETGTGKELLSRAIHENSPRADGPFLVMDCTNIPETLAESILFGHVRGAFTGAIEPQDGLFKMADKGTLLLDEVGELKPALQKSLLRVLQERRFRPVGSTKEYSSDFRLISATNRDLLSMVKRGEFRQDLYYRLTGISIPIPPLRERPSDINALIDHYVQRLCDENKNQCKVVSNGYRRAMESYPWPGNVRELINAIYCSIENAVQDDMLLVQHLPVEIRVHTVSSRANGSSDTTPYGKNSMDGDSFVVDVTDLLRFHDVLPEYKYVRTKTVDRVELHYFNALLKESNGSLKKACKLSGLSKARVYELLRKHGLQIKNGNPTSSARTQ